MIRLLETLPEGSGYLYGLIRGRYEAYGANYSFLRFYGDENGNLLSLMDDTATVCWNEENREELRQFLVSQPIVNICTDVKTAEFLAGEERERVVRIPVLKAENVASPCDKTVSLSPRELYPLLKSNFPQMPPFDGWYLDVSHRMRHGFCRVCAITESGTPISSAMTVSEWKNGAVIGGVATVETHRRQGLASRCVSSLAARLQAENKEVYICPLTDAAQRIYELLGFVVCGETAILERNKNYGFFYD